ncbi:SEC-C domain-containing protein [Kushneria aurantia]|uniref:SEC-C metal-binding domain-containing protein n=1 Tax=Kushneria aurantia TaxID=504092 RepID=A0ABV6G7H4_9GAMM|nr:SEC-C domain-containing protein [Kushneria aurantia]
MLAAWIDQLLGFAGGMLEVLRREERYPTLIQWAHDEGAELLGGDIALAQALAPLLWNQTPLERLDFDIETLAHPEPGEPCWCDSGRRFEQCCARVVLPGPIPPQLMWMLSLQRFRGATLRRALGSGRAPAQALLEAGVISAESGQLGRAQTILEALFATPDWYALPRESEPAFELLSDVYQERGFTRKKAALLDSAVDRGPDFLRGAALKRLCLIYLDSDDLPSARETFVRTLKAMPDEPALAYLESMLLLHEGQPQQARERADFWRRRLTQHGAIDEDQQVFLEQLARDPGGTLAEQMLYAEEELAEPLEALTRLLVERGTGARLSLALNSAGRVEYQQGDLDRARYQQWRRWFGSQCAEEPWEGLVGDPWLDAREWLDALCLHPEWLSTPAILQELVMALTGRFGNLPWMFDPVFEPLVARFEQWLDGIEQFQRPFVRDDGDNRILFRLGLGLVIGIERGARSRARSLSERLLRLDREDSLGFGELLLEQLLGDGQNQQALALIDEIEQIDSDEPRWLGLLLGRSLALYRLARQEEAEETLSLIARANPWVLDLLTRANPRREPLDSETPPPGSRAEAWQYRVLMRAQWRATPGALDWVSNWLRDSVEN